MRIEIYVVTTELDKELSEDNERRLLEVLKSEIVHEFGGLTTIPNCKGYWEEPTKFYKDNEEIWLIYASTIPRGRQNASSTETYAIIEAFAKRIKGLTHQKKQAFAIDGTLYLV